MEHTLALIERSHQGDKEARDTIFKENAGLIYSVAKRFLGRGVDMEDLFQIGSIGLLKAVDHFDTSFEVRFSTYAVPMIVGEIKRYLRDDGILKVSRSLKENCFKIYRAREELEKTLGREPGLGEIAEAVGLQEEEVVMSLESGAEVESLHKIIYQGEGKDIALLDRIPEKENGGKRTPADPYAVFSGSYPDGDRRRTGDFPGTGFQNGEKNFEEAQGTDIKEPV